MYCLLSDIKADEARTEGEKRGYNKASKEYESKLRSQAKEFFNQLARLQHEIESHKLSREKAEKIALEALELVKEIEGCARGLKQKGLSIDSETAEYYQNLQQVEAQREAAKAA